MKIVTGGQTGVDRAALDVARYLGIRHGGWCPKGRKAEDGVIPAEYDLKETPTSDYYERTLWNVRDSEATLILTLGTPTGGTKFTIECCQQFSKPYLVVDLERPTKPDVIRKWLGKYQHSTINVAGPRESLRPTIVYSRAFEVLRVVLRELISRTDKLA